MDFKHFDPIADPLMVGVADALMSRLDEARTEAGIRMTLTCGCRTPEHNAELKGAVADSAHIPGSDGFGHAVDFECRDNHQLFCMMLGLIKAGFRRIIVYVIRDPDNPKKFEPRHIHGDDDETKPQEILCVYSEQN